MAYYAQISDPRFGGTYMSLFNTVSNLGHQMYVSPILKIIDVASVKQCYKDGEVVMNNCATHALYSQCASMGGKCITEQDGLLFVEHLICRYYMLTWPCFIYGVIWAIVMKNQFKFLMMTDKEKWKVI